MSNPIKHQGFVWAYDESSDTLHASIDPSIEAYGDALKGFESSIILMRSFDDDHVIGFRLLGVKERGIKHVVSLLEKEKRAIAQISITTFQASPPLEKPERVLELERVREILEKAPKQILQETK